MLDDFYQDAFKENFESVDIIVKNFNISSGLSEAPNIFYDILNSEEVKSFIGLCHSYELPYFVSINLILNTLKRDLLEISTQSSTRGKIIHDTLLSIPSEFIHSRHRVLYEGLSETLNQGLRLMNNGVLMQAHQEFLAPETFIEFMDAIKFEDSLDENLEGLCFSMKYYALIPAFQTYQRQKHMSFEKVETDLYRSLEHVELPFLMTEVIYQVTPYIEKMTIEYETWMQGDYSEFRSLVYDQLNTAFETLKQIPNLKAILAQENVHHLELHELVSEVYDF